MQTEQAQTRLKIWDIWVRLFHWSLVVSVGFLLFSGETGFLFYEWHRHVGEFVLALLLFRILWGLFGSSNARLISLIQHPGSAFNHLKHLAQGKVTQERGHNAAGGWAVLVLILLLTFQAVSGLFIADEDELIEGAFYGQLSGGISEELLHLHHTVAQLLMILVGVHIAMVVLYLVRAGQNLITPMITGRLKWLSSAAPPPVRFAHTGIGLGLFLLCIGAVGWLTGWFD